MIVARIENWMRRLRLGSSAETVAAHAEPPATAYRGGINELSAVHVAGCLRDDLHPDRRGAYEVVLADTGETLARGVADQFRHGLHGAGFGDGAHAFHTRLPRPLSPSEIAQIEVRPAGGAALSRSPQLRPSFEPVLHVAMDIVDNCNLRCPFCLYDYANTRATHFMTEDTIEAALRFLPYTRDGEFWFSCLHEPTLHPQLTAFIDKAPPEYRRKLFYTTNLAKRMPATYYAWLADSGMHHINVSIESLRPELYERMRKGARHRIFKESWDALLAALELGKAPPLIRYIAMVYKSNLQELPEMVRYLLEERRAAQVELRYTFDVPHLPPEFRSSEFLDQGEWLELRDRLAHFPQDRVQLNLPPAPDLDSAPAPALAIETPAADSNAILPDYYMLRMSWDGSVRVVGVRSASRFDDAIEVQLLETNVRDIGDVGSFIEAVAARPPPA